MVLLVNGTQVNGTRAHATHVNGVHANDTRINGIRVNGIRVNGTRVNGTRVNGTRVNNTYTYTDASTNTPPNGTHLNGTGSTNPYTPERLFQPHPRRPSLSNVTFYGTYPRLNRSPSYRRHDASPQVWGPTGGPQPAASYFSRRAMGAAFADMESSDDDSDVEV
ncbi:hypothetical protein EJ06DRAFT_527277 [Trichodelitschia bisporula]|uniref:Uncharacterized protein n=1 Tax=Trichodelitschia bisporula TaxID=703511 RepID=A0A6G1I6Q5_9PEZI|nr:hypothetical protein EJ06DRAFT_527277 [Trichodelitschia bisporula]